MIAQSSSIDRVDTFARLENGGIERFDERARLFQLNTTGLATSEEFLYKGKYVHHLHSLVTYMTKNPLVPLGLLTFIHEPTEPGTWLRRKLLLISATNFRNFSTDLTSHRHSRLSALGCPYVHVDSFISQLTLNKLFQNNYYFAAMRNLGDFILNLPAVLCPSRTASKITSKVKKSILGRLPARMPLAPLSNSVAHIALTFELPAALLVPLPLLAMFKTVEVCSKRNRAVIGIGILELTRIGNTLVFDDEPRSHLYVLPIYS